MDKYLTSYHVISALANLPQLVFEVTDACNLRCKYCAYGEFYEDYDCRENKMLSSENAISLINYLVEYWNSGYNFSAFSNISISFYGGEPLLNFPFIRTVVNYIKNHVSCPHRKFSFSMTTNALLLHKYMDFLKDNDFYLLISLDGDKENNGYRVDKVDENSFDRIVANIDGLRERYPDYFTTNVDFNAVLHNKNTVESIYRFFKYKYNKIPRIGELNSVGIRKDKMKEFNETYKNSQESLYQAEHYEKIEQDMFMNAGNYRSLALFLHQYSGFVFKDYLDLLLDEKDTKHVPTGTCLPFSKKMFVTVNGKILPCERIGHQFSLGKVTDAGIELDIEQIVSKYNEYYHKIVSQCSMCKNHRSCIQCIFNLENRDGSLICHGYMGEKQFQNYINVQMAFLEDHPDAYKKIMEDVFVV